MEEKVGDLSLKECTAFDKSFLCRHCKCSYLKHQHIYYTTKEVMKKVEDINVVSKLRTRESAKRETEEMVNQLRKRIEVLRNEKDVIFKTTEKFTHFLNTNAITPYNDSFEEYLKHSIEKKIHYQNTSQKNQEVMQEMNKMLSSYNEEKAILENANNSNATENISIADITDAIEKLCKLEANGKKIRSSLENQGIVRDSELLNRTKIVELGEKK
jgi:hypothetical protein